MSYFPDLSKYTYHDGMFGAPNTLNIGWLGEGHVFQTAPPIEEFLDLVWSFCKISVAQMRGMHDCEFCPKGKWEVAERNGERLLLGTSEIRVFSPSGAVYAAPTLIYHYIWTHHYLPPDEFIRAMNAGPRPPSKEYFARLDALGLAWNETSAPAADAIRTRLGK